MVAFSFGFFFFFVRFLEAWETAIYDDDLTEYALAYQHISASGLLIYLDVTTLVVKKRNLS